MISPPSVVVDVARVIRALCRGEATHSEIERLVAMAAALARRRMHGRLTAAARVEGTSLEQASISMVAGLFAPAGRECALAQSMAEYLDGPDDELYLRFGAVVAGAAAQELFHRWRENDPLSARLWRNLHRALRNSGEVTVFPARRPRWVTLAVTPSRDIHLPAPGHEDLRSIVRRHGPGAKSAEELVVKVLRDVDELEHCRKVVSLDLLFAVVREESRELAASELGAARSREFTEPDLALAVEEATQAACREVSGRLKHYREGGKLTYERALQMERALRDLVADCADGGPAQSYYDYIAAHAPGLALQEYRSEWRTRFEYLAELARDRFFDCVRARLGADFPQERPVATKSGRKERGNRL